MANTGLRFNPMRGLNNFSDLTTSVPETASGYMQFQMPQFNLQWKPEQLQKARKFIDWSVNTSDEEKENQLDPFYELNKWNQGLGGLTQDEINNWEIDNAEKTAGHDDLWKDRLWRNQQFVRDIGLETFQKIPNAEDRDKLYKNYLLSKSVEDKYGSNENLQQLLELTPEAKEELLRSDYKSDAALRMENKQALNNDWTDYSLGERLNAITSNAVSQGTTGMGVGSVAGASFGTPLFGAGAVAGGFLGAAIGGAAGMVSGTLHGIAHPEDAQGLNAAQRKAENDEILNKISVSDNERKIADSQGEINDRFSKYLQAYNSGAISTEQVNQMFDQIALNGKRTYTDELGNTEQYDYQGSNYYSAFKDTSEFEHFGISDKLKYLAQTEVLSQKYGQNAALSSLEQEIQNYVSDNQTGWTWAGNTAKNIWVGGLANLGMKEAALGALAAKMFYGDEGLVEYLQGRDASGSGEENSWMNNPHYWNKVDQYNTLDTDAIAKADANGGVSIYQNVVKPGTENDFWSWNTLNEGVKMSKFAWSDLITNVGLAKLVKGATRLAGGIELAPGVLASESTALSKGINTVGSFGVLNASSLGIDAAYGMNTFEEVLNTNNQKLDRIIDKDTEAEVSRRLATKEAQDNFRRFVDTENQRRKQRAGERGSYIGVDEEQAWEDYTNYIRKQVRKEQEEIHAEDRQQAENDAALAYMTDATIEHIRMATTNGIFKNYLFDKGTLNALRLNNPYVASTTKNGLYALGKHATRNRALTTLGTNIWGGFHSNYFDDVTVGFAKGFGLQDYNNYLLQKYNPAAYGSVMDDYVNPFLAGMAGAHDAMLEKRSFLDGAIGAIGSPLSVSPNIGGIMSHKEIMKQAAEQSKKDKEAGNKVDNALSGWEVMSHFVNNPLVEAMAKAESDTRMTQREINRVNDIIKENGFAFDNIVETASALNQGAIAREGTSVMQAEDAKDQEAFALASSLLTLRNSAVVANAQAEPNKANWSKKKRAANFIGNALNTMVGVPLFEEASSSYQRAMQALKDASTIDEMPIYLQEDNAIRPEDNENLKKVKRQSQLVQTFLGLDANKSTISNMNEQEKVAFAQERLKKNADNLLNIMNKTDEIQQKFEKSLGANMHPDLKQQLVYQYVLDDRWQTRANELEQQITGDENPIRNTNSETVSLAKYGSMEGFKRTKKAQEKRVEQAEKAVEKAKHEVKKGDIPGLSIKENSQVKAMRRMVLDSAESTLKKEQAALEKINKDGDALTSALESGLPIVTADEILHLNPDDRLRMLDDYYRDDYSEEQQREIDKAKHQMMREGTPINEIMEKVRDAAILNHRIEDNMEVARKIMQNPIEAQMMQEALIENRRKKITDYFNDKIVAEAYHEFEKDPASTLSEDAVAKKVSNQSTAVLNGMQKAAQQEMRRLRGSEDATDATLDNIINGIEKVLKERGDRMKDVAGLDSFVRKTKKVDHTETIAASGTEHVGVDEETGEVVITPMQRVTTERELSQNDKRLMNMAMDYAVERNLSTDELAEQTTTNDFDKYIQERNHITDVENQAMPVSHDYMRSLVNDVVDAFKNNKETIQKATAPKPTAAKPESVVTPPVEPKGAKPESRTVEATAIPGEKANNDPFAAFKKPKEDESPAASTQPEDATPVQSEKNAEIIDSASLRNRTIMTEVESLLTALDKMEMDSRTRDKLKDTMLGLLESRSFPNIKALHGAILGEAMKINQQDAPQIATKASTLSSMEISPKPTASENNSKGNNENGNDDANNILFPPSTPPTKLITRDLDALVKHSFWKKFIEEHNMVGFLQKFADAWNKSWQKYHETGKTEPLHQSQVVFIYDPALAQQIQSEMEEDGMPYNPEVSAPLIMALMITNKNKHLVDNVDTLIVNKNDIDSINSLYRKNDPAFECIGFQPIGVMPASQSLDRDTKEMKDNATRMTALRNRINYNDDAAHALRYAPQNDSGKYNGTIIKTNIQSIESHTEDEVMPHGTEDTPKTGVQQLMEDNVMNPSEAFVKSTEEERQAYKQAKSQNIGALRKTSLYNKIKEAFIKRLVKGVRESSNADDTDNKEMRFIIQKGTHDTYPKIVLTKKISETADKNNPGRRIVDILKEVDDSGSNAKELIASNSRFKRLYTSLKGLKLAQGLFNTEGAKVNQTNFNLEIANFEKTFESSLKSNFDVINLHVKVEVSDGTPNSKTVKVHVFSGDVNLAENRLATLETRYTGNISEAEFASFMKDLILDAEGRIRENPTFKDYERVKWQVNYTDAETANGRSENNRNLTQGEIKAAYDNLADLFDDGVLEMQMTKLSYPARSVTAEVNNTMRSKLYTESQSPSETPAPEATEIKASFEAETNTGKVDSDTGMRTEEPTKEGIISVIPQKIKDTVKKMISDSEARTLDSNGKFYNIDGQIWSRVTSIKYTLDKMGERFNPASPFAIPSSLLGNSIDEFGRDVFNGVFDLMDDAQRTAEFEGYDNSTAKNYSEAYRALKAFEARLAKDGQVIIPTGNREKPGYITAKGTLNVTVKGEKGIETKKIRVAGTLDVLAIDAQGNLHIYDFKTKHNSMLTKEEAESSNKGYDRQLSMYAKFLEEEYGLPVKSINIIPIKVMYPTPRTQEDYKPSRVGSNQLLIKNGKDSYEEFKGANYEIGKEFDLTRLSDEQLVASFDKMSDSEKELVVEAIQDQSNTPTSEITSTDAIVDSKPETTETTVDNSDEEGLSLKGKRFGLKRRKAGTTSQTVDTSAEGTLQQIAPEKSMKASIEELKRGCGGKKK